jgi:hypothetical protein
MSAVDWEVEAAAVEAVRAVDLELVVAAAVAMRGRVRVGAGACTTACRSKHKDEGQK